MKRNAFNNYLQLFIFSEGIRQDRVLKIIIYYLGKLPNYSALQKNIR